jgi:hypothetical protein
MWAPVRPCVCSALRRGAVQARCRAGPAPCLLVRIDVELRRHSPKERRLRRHTNQRPQTRTRTSTRLRRRTEGRAVPCRSVNAHRGTHGGALRGDRRGTHRGGHRGDHGGGHTALARAPLRRSSAAEPKIAFSSATVRRTPLRRDDATQQTYSCIHLYTYPRTYVCTRMRICMRTDISVSRREHVCVCADPLYIEREREIRAARPGLDGLTPAHVGARTSWAHPTALDGGRDVFLRCLAGL